MKLEELIERIRTNSVMNPLLWLCGITEFLCIPAAVATKGNIQIALLSLAALPVLFSLVAYGIWMIVAPYRLQSEDHQYNMQRLMQGTKEENLLVSTRQTSNYKPLRLSSTQSSTPDLPDVEVTTLLPDHVSDLDDGEID